MLKYKLLVSLVFFIVCNGNLLAQKIAPESFNLLRLNAKQLVNLENSMFIDSSDYERNKADSQFIPYLVKTLKTPYSFYYNFDSFKFVKQLYAPDSSFKIFSWNFYNSKTTHRHHGVIQMNTSNGILKLFPLIDVSEFEAEPEKLIAFPDSNRNINKMWIGATYYKIIEKTYHNKKYYTLLGFDDDSDTTSIKWIEILYFNELGKPVFGGDFFNLKGYQDADLHPDCKRFRYIFKKYAKAPLNYDEKHDRIYFANLISLTGDRLDNSSLVPDGNIDFLVWEDGKWHYKIGD
ncbi:MAG: hypothetical protein QM539_08990 [Alphaproteobacteria bacterium]|nr:hypothetical protein [Alphaproteobacteria bacterium]